MGLAEKRNTSRANGDKKRELSGSRAGSLSGVVLALTLGLRFVSLEDAWMIVLQLPAFPNRRYLGWEGTPGTA